jgi:hypothetical protein
LRENLSPPYNADLRCCGQAAFSPHHNLLPELGGKTRVIDNLASEQAAFAVRAWLEVSSIEAALGKYTCKKTKLAKNPGLTSIFWD